MRDGRYDRAVTSETEPVTAPVDAPSPAGRRVVLRRALRVGWLVVLVIGLVLALRSRWAEVSAQLDSVDVGWLAVSAGFALVGVGLSAGIWHAMLRGLGEALPVGVSLRIFFIGQIGKYLPGAVWPAVTQAALARDHGVAPRATVSAVTLFLWVHLVTGAVIGILLLTATGALPLVTLVAVPALVALLSPLALRFALQHLLRLVGRPPLRRLPDAWHLATACAWAVGMWACYGVHLAAVAAAVAAPVDLLAATGTFAAAWVVGFVLLVAPAGVGPREAALVALLPLGATAGLLVALVSRLVMTAADAVWAAVTGVRPPSHGVSSVQVNGARTGGAGGDDV